jgi:hypothetical protein
MELKRLSDWKSRLIRVINSQARKPFEVGQTDCVCLMIKAVEALTGKQPIEKTWRNADHALGLLKDYGYENIYGINHIFGEPLTNWKLLRYGDIARLPPELAETWKAETYGICVGNGKLIVPGEKHLNIVPAKFACKVWRIG